MRPFDRVLCVTAGIYSKQPVEIGVGIGALLVGFTGRSVRRSWWA